MTPEDLAALERGCCTRPQAAASGCRLCVARYAAIDRVRAELDTLERLRTLPSYHDVLEQFCRAFSVPGCPTWAEALERVRAHVGGLYDDAFLAGRRAALDEAIGVVERPGGLWSTHVLRNNIAAELRALRDRGPR